MESSPYTHYVIGSVVGPHPFPTMVRDFQAVIGRECRRQCLDQIGRLPDVVVACVGGGSNAAGIFSSFVNDKEVELVGVEAGGRGVGIGEHAAPISFGQAGVLHGSRSYVLQDENGQTSPVHSISAGLDYPGVGPEHAPLARYRPGPICNSHRSAGARCFSNRYAPRGDYPCSGVKPRSSLRARISGRPVPGKGRGRESIGPRRQRSR